MVSNDVEKSPRFVSFASRKEQQEQLLLLAFPDSNS